MLGEYSKFQSDGAMLRFPVELTDIGTAEASGDTGEATLHAVTPNATTITPHRRRAARPESRKLDGRGAMRRRIKARSVPLTFSAALDEFYSVHSLFN